MIVQQEAIRDQSLMTDALDATQAANGQLNSTFADVSHIDVAHRLLLTYGSVGALSRATFADIYSRCEIDRDLARHIARALCASERDADAT